MLPLALLIGLKWIRIVRAALYELPPNNGEPHMKNPLDSLWGTVISGLVLTLILYEIVKSAMPQ